MKRCIKCNREHDGAYGSGKYCSRRCANSRTFSKESRSKKSTANKEYWISELGELEKKKRADNKKVFRLSCVSCSNQFSSSNSGKKTCSEDCRVDLIRQSALRQLRRGRSHKGTYKGFNLDSTYELAFLIYHLDEGIHIERSKDQIPYTYNGVTRTYNPDFVVDGVIYELKGYMTAQSKIKLITAEELGYNITLIDSTEIQRYIKYVESKYNVKNRIQHLYEDIEHRECAHCGVEYLPRHQKQLLCSRVCSGKYRSNINNKNQTFKLN